MSRFSCQGQKLYSFIILLSHLLSFTCRQIESWWKFVLSLVDSLSTKFTYYLIPEFDVIYLFWIFEVGVDKVGDEVGDEVGEEVGDEVGEYVGE